MTETVRSEEDERKTGSVFDLVSDSQSVVSSNPLEVAVPAHWKTQLWNLVFLFAVLFFIYATTYVWMRCVGIVRSQVVHHAVYFFSPPGGPSFTREFKVTIVTEGTSGEQIAGVIHLAFRPAMKVEEFVRDKVPGGQRVLKWLPFSESYASTY